MNEQSELKRLAEALIAANDRFSESPQDNEVGDAWSVANDRFTEAASPEYILALIADNDTLVAAAQALRDEWRKDQADAERYRWLRDKSQAVHQFYLSVPLWFTGVRFRAQDVDKAIDAMSNGEQP